MDAERDELRDELRIRWLGVPGALVLAVGFHRFALGQFLQRTFFGMWLHELGHAIAAWLCGIPAFPGPWFTPMAEGRSWPFALVISAALAAGAWCLRASGWRWLLIALLALQLACTVLLKPDAATAFVLFSGDAGAMVLGTLGMASLFAPRGGPLHRGGGRWGLLVIGAAAFVDVFSVWLAAHGDAAAIPFGANEGVGLSDPSRLVEEHGWTLRPLVNRYLAVGSLCLLALATLNALALRRARAAIGTSR